MKDKKTGEMVAVKFIERGDKVRAAECSRPPPRAARGPLLLWVAPYSGCVKSFRDRDPWLPYARLP